MTLDEAIKHCLEVAEKNECKMTSDDGCTDVSMKKCAADHRQLAEWLTDYKELREENKVLMQECDRLIKEKGALLKQHEQIAEYNRLLKSATGIIKDVDCNEDYLCDECEYRAKCDGGFSFYWRYADEALKLIGEDSDTND